MRSPFTRQRQERPIDLLLLYYFGWGAPAVTREAEEDWGK
jgi:hypothetical protein